MFLFQIDFLQILLKIVTYLSNVWIHMKLHVRLERNSIADLVPVCGVLQTTGM